jgi:hypothetical protein
MATNTAGEPVNVPDEGGENRHITSDGQSCECADHADIVDGRCRRCGLTGTASAVPVPETAEEIPVVEAPVTVVAPE